MVFSIFKNIIKSVLPASLWLNLRLFRETNINRKVAKDYIKQMLNDKSPITTQMDQHIIGACDVFEYKSILFKFLKSIKEKFDNIAKRFLLKNESKKIVIS